MASVRVMKIIAAVLAAVSLASAYTTQGVDVIIDYWAGNGGNECIIVIDWNATNGPYATESHAWGFRWDDTAYLSDALAAIDAAGDLDIVTGYGGGYVSHAYYDQTAEDGDNHSSVDYGGWWWLGDTNDGGLTWIGNTGSITSELLWNGGIEGLNLDFDNWTSSSLTIPQVPEPMTAVFMVLGSIVLSFKQRLRT